MTTKEKRRSVHWLRVSDPKHASVLGYRASTKSGAKLWAELDWSNWWIDGTAWNYFHVPTNNGEGTVYRVRCWYDKYKGRKVVSVGMGMQSGELHWIVRTETDHT